MSKIATVGFMGFYVNTSEDNAFGVRAFPALVTEVKDSEHVNITVFGAEGNSYKKAVPVTNDEEVSTEGVFIFSLDQLTEASPVDQSSAEPLEEKVVEPTALGGGSEKTED